MALTNAEKQAAYKQRMYDAGYKQVQFWIKDDPIAELRDIMWLIELWENRREMLNQCHIKPAEVILKIKTDLHKALDNLTGGAGYRKPTGMDCAYNVGCNGALSDDPFDGPDCEKCLFNDPLFDVEEARKQHLGNSQAGR
jgi:hypothetical protein